LKGPSFVKALFFGSIGTIVETSQLQYDAFHVAFVQHNLDWHWDLPTYREMLKISGGANRISAFADKRNERVDALAIHATKTSWFIEKLQSDSVKPLSYVSFGLKAAQEYGMKTGFVSTTEEATVQIIAQKLVAEGHLGFDIMTHRQLGLPEKPEPDAYIHAFQALGLEAQSAIVIEDNVDGVAAAKTAGARVVGVPGAFGKQTDLSAADITFGSGSDIDWINLFT
jgi:beta-phosphoglucomutase-like phosphatase (HAD superfamily)